MGSVLYYSNRCENSQKIIQGVSRLAIASKIHFVCVDDRVVVAGATYARTAGGKQVLIPGLVDRVPALLLLNRGNQIVFGEEIRKVLAPHEAELGRSVSKPTSDPSAFAIGSPGHSAYGVASDQYSYWDQSSDDLSAKGAGGMRQQWHYATPDASYTIETPPDTYEPDKVSSKDVESYQQARQLGTT